jgi:hypothetical protein
MEIPAALDLERFSLDNLDGASGRSLVERCRAELAKDGLFNLDGLVRPAAVAQAITEVAPAFAADAFHHARDHNIYFDDRTDVAPAEHGALRRLESSNLTICADQITDGLICHLYEWPPLARFLSLTMGMKELHTMDDPLARVNVMSYGDGQQLNWHFDRSEFTTTLLLQEADDGGVFEYRSDLRKDDDANLDGVADLLHSDCLSWSQHGPPGGPRDWAAAALGLGLLLLRTPRRDVFRRRANRLLRPSRLRPTHGFRSPDLRCVRYRRRLAAQHRARDRSVRQ